MGVDMGVDMGVEILADMVVDIVPPDFREVLPQLIIIRIMVHYLDRTPITFLLQRISVHFQNK
jgi:hypothetical protein